MQVAFLKEVKAAFKSDAEFLDFEEGKGELSGKVLVRGKKTINKGWIDDEAWKSLNDFVRDELGGKYSSVLRAWEIPLTPVPKVKPSLSDFPSEEKKDEVETKFVDGKGEPAKVPEKNVEVYAGREVKSGLPKIDEKYAAENETEELVAGKIILVEIDKIRPNKYNPNEMSDEELNALLDNMRKEGTHGTDPLLVRPLPDSKLEIIDGYHRWKAAGLLGWKKIRCIVREVDEYRAQEINYAKNKLRGHINPFKEAELFFHTWEKVKRLEDIGKKFGVSISYVSETVSLRKIPDEVQKIIPRGINRSLLEILARLEDPSDQEALAMEIASGITVRQAEDFVKDLKRAEEPLSTSPPSSPNEQIKSPLDMSHLEPPTKPLPCSACSNDSKCGRVHFHVDNAGNYVCEYQNRPLEAPKPPSAVPTAIPPAPIGVATPTPAPVKKGPYWCEWCQSNLEDDAVHDSYDERGKMCNLCGHQVEKVSKEGREKVQEKSSEKPSGEVPKVPFREAMKVNVSQAEIDLYKALLGAYERGQLKFRPFLNDDHHYYYVVRATYPDLGFEGIDLPLYLDNEDVHTGKEDWDDAVVKALERQKARPLRLPYQGSGLSQKQTEEFVVKVLEALKS